MVVLGIVGRPNARLGCGKSTFLTWLALTYHARFKQNIIANYHINLKNGFTYINNPRELMNRYNTFIALDDIYRWLGFDINKAKKISKLMAGELRHHNNNLAYVSSRLKDYVHTTLRQHTDYFVFPIFIRGGWLLLNVLNSEGEEVRGILPTYLKPAIVRKVWTFYNHREDIQITDYF